MGALVLVPELVLKLLLVLVLEVVLALVLVPELVLKLALVLVLEVVLVLVLVLVLIGDSAGIGGSAGIGCSAGIGGSAGHWLSRSWRKTHLAGIIQVNDLDEEPSWTTKMNNQWVSLSLKPLGFLLSSSFPLPYPFPSP